MITPLTGPATAHLRLGGKNPQYRRVRHSHHAHQIWRGSVWMEERSNYLSLYCRWSTWIAFGVQQTLLLFTSATDRMFPSYIYAFGALLSLGGGSFVQAGYAVIQTVVPPKDLGLAIIPKSPSNSAILEDNGRFSSAVLVS